MSSITFFAAAELSAISLAIPGACAPCPGNKNAYFFDIINLIIKVYCIYYDKNPKNVKAKNKTQVFV